MTAPAVCRPQRFTVQRSAWCPLRAMGGRQRRGTWGAMASGWGAGSATPRHRPLGAVAATGRGQPTMPPACGGLRRSRVCAWRVQWDKKPRPAVPKRRGASRLHRRPPAARAGRGAGGGLGRWSPRLFRRPQAAQRPGPPCGRERAAGGPPGAGGNAAPQCWAASPGHPVARGGG